MENVLIDVPERLEDDIEDFKLNCVDEEKNYTATKIKLCRDPRQDKPILFYSQELVRNFRDESDPFGKRHLIKVFTPANLTAIADTTLEGKYNDTLLGFMPRIKDYSPLSDIHSQKMNLFMDEETATFLSDVGINVDGLAEDFEGLETVSATPFMEEVSGETTRLKAELADLHSRYLNLKEQMAGKFSNYVDPKTVSEEVFEQVLAREIVPQEYAQTYLMLKDQIRSLEAKLGELSSAVFAETSTRIKLPRLLEGKANESPLLRL